MDEKNKKTIYLGVIIAILIIFFLIWIGIIGKLGKDKSKPSDKDKAPVQTEESQPEKPKPPMSPDEKLSEISNEEAPPPEKPNIVMGMVVSIENDSIKLNADSNEMQFKITANTKFYEYENGAPVERDRGIVQDGSRAYLEYNPETLEINSAVIQ